ncbi:MAG: hypothetical protein COB10_11980 [Planctomycetota bacterium]|nr:MAG: hypothetical protein COB10_11980 [Planctomycetota bacterium]
MVTPTSWILVAALSLSSALIPVHLSAQEQKREIFRVSYLGKELPELVVEEGGRWFNSEKDLRLADLRGKPLLLVYTLPG